MRKLFYLVIGLIPLIFAQFVFADATYTHRERLDSAPMSIDSKSGDTTWVIRYRDSNGVQRFLLNPDGTMHILDSSGITIWGIDPNGTNEYNPGENIALLSGATGDISWSASSSGASGWHLTSTNLLQYRTFYVDPSGGTSGASPYTDACPSGNASTGATIYMPTLAASMHGLVWTFVNSFGTTPFVLYDSNSRFHNVGSGSTQAPSGNGAFDANSGATSIADGLSDSVTVRCVYTPSEVSGYYVTDMYINGN